MYSSICTHEPPHAFRNYDHDRPVPPIHQGRCTQVLGDKPLWIVTGFDLLLTSRNLKLLDPRAHAHLTDIDVSLGVDRGVVKMGKFAHLVTRAPETRQNSSTGAIEYFNLLVVFIADENELLLPIARKGDRYGRAPRTRHH